MLIHTVKKTANDRVVLSTQTKSCIFFDRLQNLAVVGHSCAWMCTYRQDDRFEEAEVAHFMAQRVLFLVVLRLVVVGLFAIAILIQ